MILKIRLLIIHFCGVVLTDIQYLMLLLNRGISAGLLSAPITAPSSSAIIVTTGEDVLKLPQLTNTQTNYNSEGMDRMVSELVDHENNRNKFSRRRGHIDAADIDYINDRNKHFNQKVGRAFDKYTVEIRQNLERGTAL